MLGRSEKSEFRILFLFISFLGLWLVAGLRGDVGQDTFSYSEHFYELGRGIPYSHYFMNIEPFFAILLYFSSLLFNDVTFFFLILSLIQAVALWLLLKRVWHSGFFLFSYLFIFYLDYHMNAIRGGVAILVFLLAMSYAPSRVSVLLFLSSIMLHVSVILLAPFFVFRVTRGLKYKFLFWLALLIVSCSVVALLGEAILLKISFYFIDESFDFRIPKAMALLSLLGVLAIMLQRTVTKEFLILFFLIIITWMLNASLDIFYRINLMFLLLMFYLAFEHRAAHLRELRFRPTMVYALGLVVWFSINFLLPLPSEREKILLSGKGNPEFSFVPYSFFWSSDSR